MTVEVIEVRVSTNRESKLYEDYSGELFTVMCNSTQGAPKTFLRQLQERCPALPQGRHKAGGGKPEQASRGARHGIGFNWQATHIGRTGRQLDGQPGRHTERHANVQTSSQKSRPKQSDREKDEPTGGHGRVS